MPPTAPLLGEPLPVELMNTIWADRDGGHDALETPDQLTSWLASIGGRLDVPVDDSAAVPPATTWALARDLRDALRRLAADATYDARPVATSAGPDTQRALGIVNAAAAHAPRWSALAPLTDGGLHRVVRTGRSAPEAALSQIADEAITLFGGESRLTLRACLAPGCVLYFVKQHPRREWCSAGCGNRARVARHYERHSATRS